MTSDHQLRSLIMVLLGVHLLGTMGFMWIEDWSLLDALYMTVITISTVGFTEVHALSPQGRTFAMLLIPIGVGGMMYGLTVFFQLLVEGRIRGLLGKHKLKRGIRNMHDHCVVCGYGRVGRRVVQELRQRGELTVVVESRPECLEELTEAMIPFVAGNATDDQVLHDAGLPRAKALVVALSDQSANVFVTLSGRQMNPNLRIVARCDEEPTDKKLMIAGADAVVRPHEMGGETMALAVAEPDVIGYVRIEGCTDAHPLRIDQIRIEAGSPLCNVTVTDLPILREFNLLLIGIKKPDTELHFKPGPAERLDAGDTLVVAGRVDQLALLKQVMGQVRERVSEVAQ